jgi:hypothetical protein
MQIVTTQFLLQTLIELRLAQDSEVVRPDTASVGGFVTVFNPLTDSDIVAEVDFGRLGNNRWRVEWSVRDHDGDGPNEAEGVESLEQMFQRFAEYYSDQSKQYFDGLRWQAKKMGTTRREILQSLRA